MADIAVATSNDLAVLQANLDSRFSNVMQQLQLLSSRITAGVESKAIATFPSEAAQIRQKVLTAFQVEFPPIMADITKLKSDVAKISLELGPQNFQGVRTVVSSYVVLVTDSAILVDTSAGNVSITLPRALAGQGYVWNIFKISNDANVVTVQCTGSDTINGVASKAITTFAGLRVLGSSNSQYIAITETAA